MNSEQKPLRCIVINGTTRNEILEALMVLSQHMIKCGLKETTTEAHGCEGVELTVLTNLKQVVIGTKLGTIFSVRITESGTEPVFVDFFVTTLPNGCMSYIGRWITDHCDEFYTLLWKESQGLRLSAQCGPN